MEKVTEEQPNNYPPPISNAEAAINHFRQSLASGKHWYQALLETIGLWTDESETVQGHEYHYLIEGEAFDWLLLAERICDTVDGQVPEEEKYALLFQGKPPIEIDAEEFKRLIGPVKHHKYLNFFYGITVEEALVQTVREEVRKERHANCWTSRQGEDDEVFARVYGEPHSVLLKQFRKEKHYYQFPTSNLTEMKHFTYWCFKYRVRVCEKAKVASDTHKALEWLRRNGYRC
jgi:hypothetical protein